MEKICYQCDTHLYHVHVFYYILNMCRKLLSGFLALGDTGMITDHSHVTLYDNRFLMPAKHVILRDNFILCIWYDYEFLLVPNYLKTHMCSKSPSPVRNPELGFVLSRSWDWFVFGAQEQLWSDALLDTTNDPDGIQTHDQMTMSRNRYPLSHCCSQQKHGCLL